MCNIVLSHKLPKYHLSFIIFNTHYMDKHMLHKSELKMYLHQFSLMDFSSSHLQKHSFLLNTES